MSKYFVVDIEVAGKEKKSYKLGDTIYINNGDKKAFVLFFIPEEVLEYYEFFERQRGNDFGDRVLNENGRLDPDKIFELFFIRHFNRIRNMFLELLDRLIVEYKGFPSPFITTNSFRFIFYYDPNNLNTAFVHSKENFSQVTVYLDVRAVFAREDSIFHILFHELLHPISQLHEKEASQKDLIDHWNKHLDEHIIKNQKHLESVMHTLIENLPKHYNIEFFEKQIEQQIKYFYSRGARIFWNNVADTALGIIAIELGANDYIQNCNEEDWRLVSELITDLNNWNGHFEDHILPSAGTQKEHLISIQKLLQFVSCYQYMPYHGIAWGVLSHSHIWVSHHPYARLKDDNTSLEIINQFEKTVKELCYPDVSEYFLEFYYAYLDIIKTGAIHNNPLDPNIKKEIHDTKCLKRASRAYKLLNRGFHKLLKEVKRTKI